MDAANAKKSIKEVALDNESGADMILTYFAKDAALLLAKNKSSGGSK